MMTNENSAPRQASNPDLKADAKDDEEAKAVEIRAEIAGQFTFASHQNDVAIMADLVIANSTAEALSDLTLHASAEPEVIGTRVWTIDRIRACSEFRIRDRRIPLAGRAAQRADGTHASRHLHGVAPGRGGFGQVYSTGRRSGA